jgi:hypothetical protein
MTAISAVQASEPQVVLFGLNQEKETMPFPHMYAPVVKSLEKLKKRGESSVVCSYCLHTLP